MRREIEKGGKLVRWEVGKSGEGGRVVRWQGEVPGFIQE